MILGDKEGVTNTEEKRIERGTKRHTSPLLVRRVVHKQTQSGTTCVVNDPDCAVGAIFCLILVGFFPLLLRCRCTHTHTHTQKNSDPSLFSLFFNRLWNLFWVHAASRVKFCTKSLAPSGVKWRRAVRRASPSKFNRRSKIWINCTTAALAIRIWSAC